MPIRKRGDRQPPFEHALIRNDTNVTLEAGETARFLLKQVQDATFAFTEAEMHQGFIAADRVGALTAATQVNGEMTPAVVNMDVEYVDDDGTVKVVTVTEILRYTPTLDEVSLTPGNYVGEVEVTNASGHSRTYPEDGYIPYIFYADLGGVS